MKEHLSLLTPCTTWCGSFIPSEFSRTVQPSVSSALCLCCGDDSCHLVLCWQETQRLRGAWTGKFQSRFGFNCIFNGACTQCVIDSFVVDTHGWNFHGRCVSILRTCVIVPDCPLSHRPVWFPPSPTSWSLQRGRRAQSEAWRGREGCGVCGVKMWWEEGSGEGCGENMEALQSWGGFGESSPGQGPGGWLEWGGSSETWWEAVSGEWSCGWG